MSAEAVKRLPEALVAEASLRGDDYAWPIDDIPLVIAAARSANLVSVGGQLQFRMPGATAECHWIEVDTYTSVPEALPWADRVERAAKAAFEDYEALQRKWDFLAEGRKAFADVLARFEAGGGHVQDAMCFAWELITEGES